MPHKKKKPNITVFNAKRSRRNIHENDNVYDELNDNESINNEEDNNNMDIADSDDGSYLEQGIQCTQSTSSTESVTSTSRPIINSNDTCINSRASTLPCNDTCINSRASTLPCNAKPKALSKSQRNNRNRKIKNANEQLKKKEFYEVLESAAFQNAILES